MKQNPGDRLRERAARLRGLLRNTRALDAEVNEEFEHHIAMETEKNVRAGLSPVEARRRALLTFGGVDQHAEEMVDGRSPRWVADVWQDLRFGVRTLARSPLYATVVCLTIAMAVALNSSMFSLFDGYMFRQLPFPGSDRVVVVGATDATISLPHEIDVQDFTALRRDTTLFTHLAGFFMESASLSTDIVADRASIIRATSDYFDAYNAKPILGRGFLPEDEKAGATQVLVLSERVWRDRYGADPHVLGRSIRLNGQPATIVGVMPASFETTNPLVRVDAYSALRAIADQAPRRGMISISTVGRLRDGLAIGAAQAGVGAFAARMAASYPATNAHVKLVVVPESKSRPVLAIAAQTRRAGYAFLSLALLVLIIATVNVTNMTLARAITREREFAVRASLGASRWRVIRQVFAEMAVLAAVGSMIGMGLTIVAMRALSSVHLAVDIPIKLDFTPNFHVYGYTLIIAFITMTLTAIAPAMHTGRTSLNETLRSDSRGSTGEGRRGLRAALVVAQIAASVIVLSASALFYQSALNSQRIPLGFRTDHLLLGTTDAELVDYDEARAERFYTDLLARVRALPGVRDASLAARVPFGYNNGLLDLSVEGVQRKSQEERPTVFYNKVSADYFNTMGMSLVSGRDFGVADSAAAPRSAIVSEAMASRFWPGASALGRRFRVNDDTVAYTVVGVAGNAKYFSVGEPPREFVYLPLSQDRNLSRILHVWTTGDPKLLVDPVRSVVHQLDPAMPVFDVRPMEEHLQFGRALYFMRLGAVITACLGVLALFLCMVGLYGVMAYSVSRRTRELGVRIAFGAKRGDVLKLVAKQSLKLTMIGLVLGLAMAFAVAHVVAPLLIDAAPAVGLGATAAMLLAVSIVATLVPALRAMRVEPISALRAD